MLLSGCISSLEYILRVNDVHMFLYSFLLNASHLHERHLITESKGMVLSPSSILH